jgi:hypothetical protein
MNTDAIGTLFNYFERLLRWIYPGLLFWLALPLATEPFTDVSKYWILWEGVPLTGHFGIVVTTGFFFYLIERYVMHEGILHAMPFWWFKITASHKHRNGKEGFSQATGRYIWTRSA